MLSNMGERIPQKEPSDVVQKGVLVERREALKTFGRFMLGAGAAVAMGKIKKSEASAVSREEKKQETRLFTQADVIIEEGIAIKEEDIRFLLEIFNNLSREYPQAVEGLSNINIAKMSGRGNYLIWGTAGRGYGGKDEFRINPKLFELPEVLKVLVTHEFGHLVYKNIIRVEKKNQLFQLLLEIERQQREGAGNIGAWFAEKNYVEGESIGYKGHDDIGNPSELFAMAFAVKKLHWAEMKELFYDKANAKEKNLADRLFKSLPDPAK